MAGQIRITPDVMRQRAGQYRNEAANVNAVIASMDNLLGMLQSEWEGEASRSYAQRYAELTSGNGSLAQLDSLTANLRAMMDDLSYDHDELVAQSDYIYTNRNAPFNAEYSEKERIQYGRSIREASETIRAIIPAVVQHYPSWEQSLARWYSAVRWMARSLIRAEP